MLRAKRTIMTTLITGAIVAGCGATAKDPNYWLSIFGRQGSDIARNVHPTEDGGYLTTSYSALGSLYEIKEGALLSRVDSTGKLLWSKGYVTGLLYGSEVNAQDGLTLANGDLIKIDLDGNVVDADRYHWVTATENKRLFVDSTTQTADGGYLASYWQGSNTDACGLMKINSDSTVAWAKNTTVCNYNAGSINRIGAKVIEHVNGSITLLSSVVQSVENGGYSTGGAILTHFDAVGNVQWRKIYNVADPKISFLEAFNLAETQDTGIVVSGSHGKNAVVFKVAQNGTLQWAKTFGFNDEFTKAYDVIQTADGGLAFFGNTSKNARSKTDYATSTMILRTNSQGDLAWAKAYLCADQTIAADIKELSQGGFATNSFTTDFYGGNGQEEALMIVDDKGDLPGNYWPVSQLQPTVLSITSQFNVENVSVGLTDIPTTQEEISVESFPSDVTVKY